MKSYTDLEQSKKLVEILPLESGDMVLWGKDFKYVYAGIHAQEFMKGLEDRKMNYVPCWSLAALIEVLPSIEGFKPVIDLDINQIRYEGKYRDELCFNGNNLIDTCYEMILKLNELKVL